MLKFLIIALVWSIALAAHAMETDQIAVLKTGPTVLVWSRFSERYDVLIKIAPGAGGQINFAKVSFPASAAARYPDQGMLYYHKTTDDTPPWIINGHYAGGNHGGVAVKQQTYLVDGRTPLADDTYVRCAFLEIVDEHDVMQKVDGRPEVLLANRIVYRLQPMGACTIAHYATVRRACRINLWALTQAMMLSAGDFSGHDHPVPPAFDRHDYFIPKTRFFERDGAQYDFSCPTDYRAAPVPIKFDLTMVGDTNNLPDRFMQLLGSREQYRLGFVCGYSLLEGVTRPAERARRCQIPVELSKVRKTYPHALDDLDAAAGTELYGLAYRQYFDPAAFTNATAVYWHRQGEADVVYLHYNKPVERAVVRLPDHLAGSKITVIEQTPGMSLLSGAQAPPEGLVLSVSGDRGHMVLRLQP